jgi:hypothetical protein
VNGRSLSVEQMQRRARQSVREQLWLGHRLATEMEAVYESTFGPVGQDRGCWGLVRGKKGGGGGRREREFGRPHYQKGGWLK